MNALPPEQADPQALLAASDFIEAFIVDVNGIPRGKWLQPDKAKALLSSGIAIPRSAYLLDVWGRDIVEGGLAYDTGDPDGLCVAVPHSVSRMAWAEGNAAQALLTMREADGTPYMLDPRGVLANVVARYRAAGLTPALGVELEFYLMDAEKTAPRGADHSGWRGWQADAVGLGEMHGYEAVLREMMEAAAQQRIRLETVISESGPGQFEVTLQYAPDALRVADCAVLFKRTIKQVARRHGLVATFMAKPYGEWAGSGMHVHMSLLGSDGGNVFNGPALRHALAGVLAAMPETMLLLAPHANSYRRFAPNLHAPTFADWGRDNRMAAIRVIDAEPKAARLEHRVAGADCNPYLVFAALLGTALDGVEAAAEPGPETLGDVKPASAARLPTEWGQAIEAFAGSDAMRRVLGTDFQRFYLATKRQEVAEFRVRIPDVEHDAYLKNA